MRRLVTALVCVGVLAAVVAVPMAGSVTVPAASGMGKYLTTSGDVYVQFSFAASMSPDGSVQGIGKFRYPAYGFTSTVDFDCLIVDGNTAYLGGVEREEGRSVRLFVRDNGEGVGAPADGMGLLSYSGGCGTPFGELIPVLGQIQVRG